MDRQIKDNETEILKTYNNGEWKSTGKIEARNEELQNVVRNTIKKDKRVNIRISSRDLMELQRKAIQEGLPYQTFIASILHKFINGKLTSRS